MSAPDCPLNANFYYRNPTIGIVNTDQNQTIGGLASGVTETFDYMIYSKSTPNTNLNGNTGMGAFVNIVATGEPFTVEYRNPEINNSPDPQMWGYASVASSNAVGNSGIYFVSSMLPDPNTYQEGYYGNIGLYTSGQDFRGNIVQPQWWANKFKKTSSVDNASKI